MSESSPCLWGRPWQTSLDRSVCWGLSSAGRRLPSLHPLAACFKVSFPIWVQNPLLSKMTGLEGIREMPLLSSFSFLYGFLVHVFCKPGTGLIPHTLTYMTSFNHNINPTRKTFLSPLSGPQKLELEKVSTFPKVTQLVSIADGSVPAHIPWACTFPLLPARRPAVST